MPRPRKSKTQSNTRHKTLTALFVGVGVIMFWRGMWGLLDMHLIPHNPALSNIISLLGGLLILYSTHYLVKELL